MQMLFRFADPKVATRNFVGIVHAQVRHRALWKMREYTEYNLQSGDSQR